ncbi:hypothetical protein [Shinella pollutisoli]|uniref:Uncharacterized protein n=1 Tax=Shinella pollutisoli TaxID=2250594 RepID=A0ABV7DCC8_9HYPH|nr:hypothetical protein [Shinella pollutisoli]
MEGRVIRHQAGIGEEAGVAARNKAAEGAPLGGGLRGAGDEEPEFSGETCERAHGHAFQDSCQEPSRGMDI